MTMTTPVGPRSPRATTLAMLAAVLLVAGCVEENDAGEPAARPVRTITVATSDLGEVASLTGTIAAEQEVARELWLSGSLDAEIARTSASGVPHALHGPACPSVSALSRPGFWWKSSRPSSTCPKRLYKRRDICTHL